MSEPVLPWPLGINPIFFAVEFFDEFAAEYCFTPVTSQQSLSQRGDPLKLLPSAGSSGRRYAFVFSAGL
jgi:hypothetical protein